MSRGRRGENDEPEAGALRQARAVAGALAAAPLVLAGATGFFRAHASLPLLGSAAALAGLVGPLIGYRVYAWLRERLPPGATRAERCACFVRATSLSLAVTESIALFGLLAYWLSAVLAALVGVMTHVILVGAVWPTPERLETFLDHAADSPGGTSP